MGGVLLFLSQQQTGEKTAAITYSPEQFQFVVGSGHMSAGKLLIDGYEDGHALLSSGPVKVHSETHFILRLEISTGQNILDSEQVPAFYWRQKAHPAKVARLSLSGTQVVDLGKSEDWTGEITEFGFLFTDVDGQAPELGAVSLGGNVLATQVALMLQAWFQFESWSQRSVHFLYGGAQQHPVPLPLVVLIWALATMLIYRLFGGRRPMSMSAYGMAMLLVAWMVLDVRWTANGVRQMKHSITNQWALSNHERMLGGLDGNLYGLIKRFKDKILNEESNRILVVGNLSRFEYHIKRTRYHLFPDSVLVSGQLSEKFDPRNLDYVLFIDDFASKQAGWNQLWQQLPITDDWRDSLQLADSGEMGILFSVRRENP